LEKCFHCCCNINCAREFLHEVKDNSPLDLYWQLCEPCAITESQKITNGKANEKILSTPFNRSTETAETGECEGWTYGWGEIEAAETSDFLGYGPSRFTPALALESRYSECDEL
jgi:hypothetical protein